MIIKGQVRGAIGWLADHLTSATNNEKVTLITSNIGTDIRQTLYDMRTMHGSDKRSVIHFKLAVEHSKSNSLSIKDWKDIAKELVRFLGLKNHAYTLLLHEKDGIRHAHLVVSMKDFDDKRFNDHKIFQRNMACQRLICEKLPHLGLTPARRGYDENGNRISKSRKSDADFSRESVRGHVEGLSSLEVANLVTKLWQEGATIQDGPARATAFQKRMQAHGFALFEGERGPGFIHPDDPANFHPLARRLGIKVKEARELMRGLELPPYIPASKSRPNPPDIVPAVLAAQSRRTKRNDEHAQERAFRLQKGEQLSRQRHADDRRQTPDARRQTPDARRQTPDARRQTPDARRQTPDARRQERLRRLHSLQEHLGSATGMARIRHYISISTPLTVLNNTPRHQKIAIDTNDITLESIAYYRHRRRQ